MSTPVQHLTVEDSEDALIDGDRPFVPGSARDVLRDRVFKVVFFGAFASNIGTWMQNAVLMGYAFTLTHSATYVGVIVFAQLGPLLLLSAIGGWVADIVDRRMLLVWVSVEQLVFSVALGLVVRAENPSQMWIFLMVLAIGIGQAMFAPAYSALLPSLVSPENLAPAISLNSAQMNGARVIGPAIGGVLLHVVGAEWVFYGNAATYLFVIAALMAVKLPPPAGYDAASGRGFRQLTAGLRVAKADRVVRRSLVTIFVFSAFALTFVGQLSVVAEENFGIDADSLGYGLMYATFGVGAALGALSIGTVLAKQSLAALVRVGMLGYAITLAVFALLRAPGVAFPVVAVLGFFYFAMVTSLSTALQERLDDSVRGRVMALWIMGFGGTVGLGNLIAGKVIDATSVTAVLLVNAVVALGLTWYADVRVPVDAPRFAVLEDEAA
ncbi:MAG TPA: MFS transporter [Acidimicrobiales bacterium]|jgi:MFS family permease